ncbi:DUF5681 domain-containing protein [Halomonas sp. H5]|uniref:DUF5681 domain-containing protein n=1 Tax=Halomonas sp. H5 TaxID=3423910 RepID=UPI003D359FEA
MAFEKGRSGNPKGRPPGRPDHRAKWRKELEKHGDDLVAKAVTMALAGDSQALKLCIDRAIPAYRPTTEPVRFEMTGDTLSEKAESVLTAIADGSIPPDSGKSLLDALAGMSKIAEIDEIRRRLDALEAGS